MFSISYVTSYDPVIRGSSDITTLQGLVAIVFGEEKIMFLMCHITSCDHVFRGSCDIMGEFSSI